MEHPTRSARVLPLEQSDAFYHKRARRRLGQMDYPRAVVLLREAVRRAPESLQYRMEMAEALAGLCCFKESNELLFQLVSGKHPLPDGYFGLGCNFIALKQPEKARESFCMYLRCEPHGIYREEIRDKMQQINDLFGEADDLPARARVAARNGKRNLDDGAYDKAIRQLSRVLCHAPEATTAHNLLSIALYRANRVQDAIDEARAVLRDDANDAQALCNLAVFLDAAGRRGEAMDSLKRCEDGSLYDPDDLYKLCITCIDLADDGRALRHTRTLCAMVPYDRNALHLRAAACANVGRYREAESCWRRILAIHPEDTVAMWYAHEARLRPGDLPRITGEYQVPREEASARVRAINAFATEGLAAVRRRWYEEESFRALFLWGVYFGDPGMAKSLLHVISSFGDRRAETALRVYVTRDEPPDALKRYVLGLLSQMRSEEPYIAVLEDVLVAAHVSAVRLDATLPPGYDRVLSEAVISMSARYADDDLTRLLARIWTTYAGKQEGRSVRITRVSVWAASLECAFVKLTGKKIPSAEIARFWDVSSNSVRAHGKAIIAANLSMESVE